MTNAMRFGLFCLALAVTEARADVVIDATSSGGGPSTFGTLDLTTGVFSATSTLSVTVLGLTSTPGGVLYASDSNGFLDTISNGVATQYGSATAPIPTGGSQTGEFGLAYAGNGFYAENLNGAVFGAGPPSLDHFSADGNSVSTVGTLLTSFSNFGSGSLVFGPSGTLYLVAADATGAVALFGVNTTTGAATEIGSGLGTLGNDVLTLASVGGRLYGIDTSQASGSGPINIYIINTTTGVATATGVTVTGVATGFTVDTISAVPEPSSLALCGVGAIGIAIMVRRRHGRS